jgi:hypothetical protein
MANTISSIPNQDSLGVGFSPVVYTTLGIILKEGLLFHRKGLTLNFNTQELMIISLAMALGLASNGETTDRTCHAMGIVFGYVLRAIQNTHKATRSTRTWALVAVTFTVATTWLFFFYGSEEQEIAASFNMGCNYLVE